jgi:hypothetical protein
MPRWPAWLYDSKAHAAAYPKDDVGAATGMQDFLAAALLNLV